MKAGMSHDPPKKKMY